MKKKVVLTRVFHREKSRIIIGYDFDSEVNGIVRSLKGRNYSNTLKGWYVDDNEESISNILLAFKDKADVDISALSSPSSRHTLMQDDSALHPVKPVIKVEQKSQQGNDPPVKLPLSSPKIIPGKKSNSPFGPVEFRVNEADGRLSVKFAGLYKQEWIEEIRSFGKFYFDKTHKEFLMKWTQMKVDSLSDYFSTQGVEVIVIRPVVPGTLKEERTAFSEEVRSRKLNTKAIEGVELLRKYLSGNRYSEKTSESYLPLLEVFFKYYNDKDPAEITHDEVTDFMNAFIVKLGFSASYQNQMISAIKTFYEISGKGKVIPDILERPRHGRHLPKVFSREEVSSILGAPRNLKHKLLLWIIYSCGLRRSEAINIRLIDLDRARGILHIVEGKGNVDRVVPISDKVWLKIDEYCSAYRPVKYLFEGQSGGRYSAESVYNVFKQALKKAGIKKEVGIHSLRHSYATHLHEAGLDIKYIQELLGHKSSKTTEIYTHVSRRNLVAVRSPIEDLDIK